MPPFLVVASAVGYFAGKLQQPGDRFEVPDDGAFSKTWMERLGDGEASAALPIVPVAPPASEPIAIPSDWKVMHWKKRVALAKSISGQDDVTPEMALVVIEAEVDQRDVLARQGKVPLAPSVPVAPAPKTDDELIAEAAAVAAAAEAADAAAEADDPDDADI